MSTDTDTRTPIQRAAREALDLFKRDTRDDGSEYWYVETGGAYDPDHWVTQLCIVAHGDMFPDDHRYAFIVSALYILADADDTDDARAEIEADVYTAELTKWLASSLDRIGYVDEAVSEYGAESFSDDMPRSGFDLTKAIAMGQIFERTEVFDSVLSSLEARAERDTRAADDGDEEDDVCQCFHWRGGHGGGGCEEWSLGEPCKCAKFTINEFHGGSEDDTDAA